MYIYTYVHIWYTYIYDIHIFTYDIHIFTYVYIYLHTFTYIYIYSHIFTYIYIYLLIFTYIYIYLHIFTYIYIYYIYTYTYEYVYIYIYIYIHTCTFFKKHILSCLRSSKGNKRDETAISRCEVRSPQWGQKILVWWLVHKVCAMSSERCQDETPEFFAEKNDPIFPEQNNLWSWHLKDFFVFF